ncbi:amino acid ABC transporter substrate-binding protein [Methylobacterium sp. NPDC080182]|uniref:amino acid ABC transporter substrate-binding protein n=1 Tax=Methylobacterium sp. NPDC080182 TaxID=3390590 RepID=UPI003CFCA594
MSTAKTIILVIVCALISTMAAHAEPLTGTAKKISDQNAIAVGYRETSIPMSYLGADLKPIGYAIEICSEIIDYLRVKLQRPKLEIRYVPVTSATRVPLVANGTIDLECGSTTNNEDRQKQVAFSETYFLTAARFAHKNTVPLDRLEDLRDATVVSTAGTTNIKELHRLNKDAGLNLTILTASDHAEAFLNLDSGRAKAFFMDDIVLAGLIANAKDPSAFEISKAAYSHPEPLAVVFRRDDQQFKWLVDEATRALYPTEKMLAIYHRWFESALPPRGTNLQIPLSEPLRRAFKNPTSSAKPDAYE